MKLGRVNLTMTRGDSVRIKPGVYHQFTGIMDSEIIEFSTRHDNSDTYRKSESGKVFFRKAYDYDGVVSRGVKMQKGAPIITGRSFEEVGRIKVKGHPIYFNPRTYTEKDDFNSATWKAHMIRELGIEEFYEDNDEQVFTIRTLCPNCNVIKI